MIGDNISIKAVNVELTEERRMYVMRNILPLLRLLSSPKQPQADVILRSIRRPLSGTTYCLMLRVQVDGQTYYAVAMSHYFERAVREARDELRKSMSRSYTPDTKTLEHLRTKAHEKFFVELFAH